MDASSSSSDDWVLFEDADTDAAAGQPDVDISSFVPLVQCRSKTPPASQINLLRGLPPSPPDSTIMATATLSPSSSPRLPSPPPFTEVQIGPQSPTVGDSTGNVHDHFLLSETDDGSTRRIRPGTKAVDMASGPPLIPLSQLDSPFQLQEHLKALYHHYTKPDGSRTVVPISREVAMSLAKPPESVERSLWLYELCRFLTMKVNNLIIAFFAEDPPCSAQTCPEMRASEWQYLCAVHDPPKSCCAIDYCCHTVDWATNILTSPKYFPSRLTLGSEAGGGPQASMRNLTNIFRRLYRIFAHAWFQHRAVFWQVEGHDGLYVFFKTVCDMYNLIPEDNYTIPAEAEGPVAQDQENVDSPAGDEVRRFSILRKDDDGSLHPQSAESDTAPSVISTGATTRRHKHSPSTGSSVTTIAEGPEEVEHGEGVQGADETSQLQIHISEPALANRAEAQDQLKQDAKTPSAPKEESDVIPLIAEAKSEPTADSPLPAEQQESTHTTSETPSDTTSEEKSSVPPSTSNTTPESTDPIAETTAALAALNTNDPGDKEPKADVPSIETQDATTGKDNEQEEQTTEDTLATPIATNAPTVTVESVVEDD